jgi:hypothetical protein
MVLGQRRSGREHIVLHTISAVLQSRLLNKAKPQQEETILINEQQQRFFLVFVTRCFILLHTEYEHLRAAIGGDFFRRKRLHFRDFVHDLVQPHVAYDDVATEHAGRFQTTRIAHNVDCDARYFDIMYENSNKFQISTWIGANINEYECASVVRQLSRPDVRRVHFHIEIDTSHSFS